MASVVTVHNFTVQISPVWLTTLALSLVEMRPYEVNFIFISGLMQFVFSADLFKPKLKFVCDGTRSLGRRSSFFIWGEN